MSLGAQHSVTVDGASISYFDLGRGQPLIFVHGYFLSSRTWRKVIPLLEDDYRCIALDLLGAGSTTCNETCDFSLAGQVKMLSLFLDALNLSSVALIAHDSGAMVTRQFAATFPERVSGLVLSDTEIPGYKVRSFAQAERLLRVPGVARLFEGLLGSRLLWNRLLRAAISDVSDFDSREFLDTHRVPLRRSRDRRRATLRAGVQFDSRLVDSIQHERLVMPKLTLWGERDAFISARRARMFHDTLPDPKNYSVIANCGTLPHEEKPTQWLSEVRPFLAQLPSPSAV
jgi:pimeloyl-ACP methyl ester carboxylesterase